MKQRNGRIFSESEWAELASELALSPRQAEIVQHLFSGLGDKQIARQMDMSFHTVRTHMTRMFEKLQVADRQELILHIFNHYHSNNHNCKRSE